MRGRDVVIGLAVAFGLLAAAELFSRHRLSDPEEYRNLALKLFYAPHHQPIDGGIFVLDRRLFWKFDPGYEMSFKERKTNKDFPLAIDRDGFRIEQIETQKATGETFTIASFGDSCTAGLEVESTYSRELGRLVARKNPDLKVRVRNGGTSGYTSEQGLRQVQDFLAAGERPQVALVHFGHNDATPAFEDIPDKYLKQNVFYRLRLRKYLTNSYLAVLLFEWLQNENPVFRRAIAVNSRVDLKDYTDNLRDIVRLLKAAGARPALVNSIKVLPEPGYHPPDEIIEVAERLREYNQLMKRVSEEEHIPYVDIWPKAEAEGNQKFFNDPSLDTIHPSPDGHRWIAEEIFARLEL